jgi:hypothetical protein
VSYKLSDAARVIYLPAREKSVLRVLCDHAHDDGTESRASIYTLMMETGFKRGAVKYALRWLEENGFIVADTDKLGGFQRPVTYSVLLPDADVVAALLSTYGSHHMTRSPHDPVTRRPGHDLAGPGHHMTGPGHHMTATRSPHDHESVLESVLESVFESNAEGRTVEPSASVSQQDIAELRPILRAVKETWSEFFTEILPAKHPKVHKNQRQVWAEQAQTFQSFANQDYTLLKGLLKLESTEELITRWQQFIEAKNESDEGWDDVKCPFRIFARQ